ncbi:hypothetical protein, partial [Streptococcus suis]|uniref:hypothetical protein n=1 Tax=Streptococcus suis TaxID=1307 RepID=UPI0037047ABF
MKAFVETRSRYTKIAKRFCATLPKILRIEKRLGKLPNLCSYQSYFTVAVLVITSTAFFTAMSCLSISGESKL